MGKYIVVGGGFCTLYGPATLNECRSWLKGYSNRSWGGWPWLDIRHIEDGTVETCIITNEKEA